MGAMVEFVRPYYLSLRKFLKAPAVQGTSMRGFQKGVRDRSTSCTALALLFCIKYLPSWPSIGYRRKIHCRAFH